MMQHDGQANGGLVISAELEVELDGPGLVRRSFLIAGRGIFPGDGNQSIGHCSRDGGVKRFNVIGCRIARPLVVEGFRSSCAHRFSLTDVMVNAKNSGFRKSSRWAAL